MTRFASIMGVAAVATLVLLSGCETPMKTDYAKKLEGTWKVELDRMVPIDPRDAMSTPVSAKTTVTAGIAAGDKANTGSFSLEISDAVAARPVQAPPVSVTGTIEVDASEIKVTITALTPEALKANPAVSPLTQGPQTLTYKLMDNKLTVASPLLPVLLGDPTHAGSLTLTKQ